MKIYTKGGDEGDTSLVGGKRVPKDHPLIEAYGSIDELNSVIGLILAELPSIELENIQQQLFTIAGMLATEPANWEKYWNKANLSFWISEIEIDIDNKSEQLPPLNNFILPGGDKCISQVHFARTICRRAERNIARLTHDDPAYLQILQYVNRLSDYLFIYARYLHKIRNIEEKFWISNK